MEIIRKGIRSIIFNFFGAFLGLSIQFIAAKLLGTIEFGRWNYFLGIANTIVLTFSFGVNFFLPRELNKTKKPKYLFSQIYFSLLVAFLIAIPALLYYVIPRLQVSLRPELIVIFSLVLTSVNYYRAYLIGLEEVDKATIRTNTFLKLLTLTIFILIFYTITKTSYSLIIATLIANLIVLIPFLTKTLTKAHLTAEFFKGSFIFYLIQLLYGIFNEYSKVLQSDLFGLKEVSFLSIALILGQILLIFGQNFANASMPTFSKAFNEKNTKLLDFSFREATRINAYFIVPIFIFFFLNSKVLLSFIGDEYIKGEYMLKLILIGSFISAITGANGSLILMTKKEKIELGNGIIKILIFLSTFLILGKKYIWGIAFSIALSEVFVNLLKTIEVYRIFQITPFNKTDGKYIFKIFLLGVTLHFGLHILMIESIYRTLISLILCITLILLTFHLSPNDNDKNFILKLLRI
jgi:O-antigen/teichoic acid export membrane protein